MNQRQLGISTLVLSAILAAAAIAFSTNPCYAEMPLVTMLLNCIRIDEVPTFNDYGPKETYILTKYVLLGCAAIAAVGYLWLKGVLPAPNIGQAKGTAEKSDTPNS